MKKEGNKHPILFVFKLAALLLFVVIPITAWRDGQNKWITLHEKKEEK